MLQINEVAPAQLFEYSVMQLIISKIRKTFLRHKIESYVLCGPYLIVFNGSHLIMCQTYHRIKARSNLWGQIQGMSVIELQKKIILNTKQFLINRSYVIIKLIFNLLAKMNKKKKFSNDIKSKRITKPRAWHKQN